MTLPPATANVALDLPSIARRLKGMKLPEVDLVVGIATGGVVPASLIAYQLELPLCLLHINYRGEDNRPRRSAPALLGPACTIGKPSRVLLVDDVSVTGHTLEVARSALAGHAVTTCVMKGRADHVAFPEIGSCVMWPWKIGERG